MDVCARPAGSTAEPLAFTKAFGSLPIMLQSRKCHLRGRTREQLVALKEEPDEFGGVFICNGIERIIRMLVQQRRHFIMALNRSAYGKRGTNYTPYATLIRCAARPCCSRSDAVCEGKLPRTRKPSSDLCLLARMQVACMLLGHTQVACMHTAVK